MTPGDLVVPLYAMRVWVTPDSNDTRHAGKLTSTQVCLIIAVGGDPPTTRPWVMLLSDDLTTCGWVPADSLDVKQVET